MTEVVHAKKSFLLIRPPDAMGKAMEAVGRARRVQATVRRVSRLSPRVLGLEIVAPPEFQWQAGQHLPMSGVPEGGEVGYYSIASAPRAAAPGEFELAVAEDSLRVGRVIESGDSVFLGVAGGEFPLARLFRAERVVLVGMGTGVAPLRAAVQALCGETSGRDRASESTDREPPHVTLIQGARTYEELFYREEFEALRGERFEYRPVVSRPEVGYAGLTGRVQAHLVDQPTTGVEYCLCGSGAMVSEVRAQLLRQGVKPTSIYGEGY